MSFSSSSMILYFLLFSKSLRFCSSLNFFSRDEIWIFLAVISEFFFWSAYKSLFFIVYSSDFMSISSEFSTWDLFLSVLKDLCSLFLAVARIFFMAECKFFSIFCTICSYGTLPDTVWIVPRGLVSDTERVRSLLAEPGLGISLILASWLALNSWSILTWSENRLLSDPSSSLLLSLDVFFLRKRGFIDDCLSLFIDSFSFLLVFYRSFIESCWRETRFEIGTHKWGPWFCWYISNICYSYYLVYTSDAASGILHLLFSNPLSMVFICSCSLLMLSLLDCN